MARILVIEDNEFTRHSVTRVLETMGHEVVSASNGRDGVALYLQERPDLVLTDLFMPETDGFAAIRAVKQHDPSTKVICMSAGAGPMSSDSPLQGNVLRHAAKAGADIGLAKPFTRDILENAVNALLPHDLVTV